MRKLIILITIFTIGYLPVQAQWVSIKAKITDVDTMMVLVRGMNWSDTIYTNTGQVNYRKKLTHPEMLNLIFVKNAQSIEAIKKGNERMMRAKEDGRNREVFCTEGKITMQSKFANISKSLLHLEKPQGHELYITFRKRFDPLVKIARIIIDSSAGKSKTAEGAIYKMLYERVLHVEQQVAHEFVKEHAGSAIGAYILYRYCREGSLQQLDSLYNLFSPRLKNSSYLVNISAKIQSLKALIPGKPVPPFTATDKEGRLVNIAMYKGKYVVLDFWGSWCKPCIDGFPLMKTYQAKFKDQCVFIGIACNDEYANWQKALQNHNPAWQQVLNQEHRDDIAARYNVEAYPTKIIIDPSGAFLTSFVGETTAFYQYLDQLFNKQPMK